MAETGPWQPPKGAPRGLLTSAGLPPRRTAHRIEPVLKEMKAIGIDISRPRPGWAAEIFVLHADGTAECHAIADANGLAAEVAQERPVAIAVGAPLRAPDGVAARLAERQLRLLQHANCINPRFAPLPVKMRTTLARRGAALARSLNSACRGAMIIETHPAAVREFIGLGSEAGAGEVLMSLGLHIEDSEAGDALLCALTARRHLEGKTLAFGDEEEGLLHLPRPRRVSFVALDVDGTLTEVGSPWRHAHQTLGLWQGAGEGILKRWLAGEISYDRFCELDVKLWNDAGVGFERVAAILDAIPIRPRAPVLLRRLVECGVKVVLISSGFKRVARRIAGLAAVDGRIEIIANELSQANRGRIRPIVNVSGDAGSMRSKGGHVRRALERAGVSPIEALAIGDGPSDRYMFERCAQVQLVESDDDLERAATLACGPA